MSGTVEIPSAETAIDQARESWIRGYRDAQAAGREIPVVDVPASIGDVARTSVEATRELARAASRSSFTVGIDLRALEEQRRTRPVAPAHTTKKGRGRARKKGGR